MGWARLEASANRVALDRLGGVSVVAGAVSGRGFLAQNVEVFFEGAVEIIEYVLTAPTEAFGSLAYGQAITVAGDAYKVLKQPGTFDTGEWCRIQLIKVAAVAAPRASRVFRTGSGLVLRSGAGRSLQAQPA